MEEKRKRVRREDDKIKLRWGDKEAGIPIKGILAVCLLVIILLASAVILFSDWNVGPIKHDASDVPVPKAVLKK